VEEAGESGEGDAGQRQRLQNPLPRIDQRADARLVRQTGIERRPVGMVQNVHHMRAADARRIVEPGIDKAARRQVDDALACPGRHVRLRSEHDRPGGACLDAGRLEPDADAIRTQGAFVRLMVHRTDPRDVERTACNAIAAADAVLADEVDDAVGVLHDRPRRRAGFQAARVLAVHAAVLADQPLEIALLILPFGETH